MADDEQSIAFTTTNWSKLALCGWKYHYMEKDIRMLELELQCNGQTGRTLLTVPELVLHHGHVYALVGRNGLGKSTFLNHIAEKRIEGIPQHFRYAYVDDDSSHKTEIERLASGISSEVVNSGVTAAEFLLAQHKERASALEELQKLFNDDEDVEPEAIEAVSQRLAAVSADAQEGKAHKILHGLGVDGTLPMKALSGGWQHRVALAASLFVDCDVLLLDEPTNHLDIYGIAWLEGEIARQAKAGRIVVVVSHDFWFLDSVATDVLAMENGTITSYKGNYTKMLETRQLKIQQHERAFAVQERRRRQLEATIERMQTKLASQFQNGKGARMIRSRRQELKHRLGTSLNNVNWKYSLMGPRPEVLAPPGEDPIDLPLHTDVTDIPDASGAIETTLLQLTNAQFAYPPTSSPDAAAGSCTARPSPVHKGKINMTITASTRIALVGRNGSGKTTLLKLLAGTLFPTKVDEVQIEDGQGGVTQSYRVVPDAEAELRWDDLRVAYVKQHAVTDLSHATSANASLTPLEFLTTTTPAQRHTALKLLQAFSIVGKLAEESHLRSLSSGQRVRVLLAAAMAKSPHLLLLDEPTCHLDAETSAALSESLAVFEGAVVVSSHDVRFISDLNAQLFCTDPQLFGWIEASPVTGQLKAFESEEEVPFNQAESEGARNRTAIESYKAHLLDCQSNEMDVIQARVCGAGGVAVTPTVASSIVAGGAFQAELPGGVKKSAGGVKCRHCGGDHFSAKCPEKVEALTSAGSPPAPLLSMEQSSTAIRNSRGNKAKGGAVQQFLKADTRSNLRKAVPNSQLPSTVEKATDGEGDWHVVVSKGTKDKMRKHILQQQQQQ